MANLSSLLKEAGVIASDVAKFTNQTLNQTASQAAGGVAGLAAAGVEAVRGGDPGAAFRAVQESVTASTTLPAPEYQSNLAKATGGAVSPLLASAGVGMATVAENTGQYWEGATGSTAIGGVTAALASIAGDVVEKASRVPVPKSTGGVHRQIIAGPSAIDVDTLVSAESDRFNGATNYDIIKKHGIYRDMQGVWRKWISDDGAEINMGAFRAKSGDLNGTTQSVRAGDLIEHPELFKYYPEAADMEIEVTFDSDNAGTGMYVPKDNKIYVVADPANQDQLVSVVLHELQHKVQNTEVIAGGTSPDFVKQHIRAPLALTKKKREIKKKINDYYAGRDPDISPEDFEDLQIAYQALSDKSLYYNQLGEKEAYTTEALRGRGLTESEGAAMALQLTHSGTTNVIESAPSTMEDFLDSYPSLWGRREVLKYIVDDPALLDKYGDAKHFGLKKATQRKRTPRTMETSTSE